MNAGSYLLLLGVLLLSTGCGPSNQAQLVKALNSAASIAEQSHVVLASEYEREQEQAVDSAKDKADAIAKVAKIRSNYAPVWVAYRSMRLVWIDIATAVQIANASPPLSADKLFDLLGKLADANRRFAQSVKLLH